MLQIKSSWKVPLERCQVLRISRPHRVSVFGYDDRDTWRMTLDGADWGRAEEWEARCPPAREQRVRLLQVFSGRREVVLTVRCEQRRFLFHRGEALLGSLGPERRGLMRRGRAVALGERAWASLEADSGGWRLEDHRGACLARITDGETIRAVLQPAASPGGVLSLEVRLLILAVALSLAADLPVLSGDWRRG